jgi:hypothetical protein
MRGNRVNSFFRSDRGPRSINVEPRRKIDTIPSPCHYPTQKDEQDDLTADQKKILKKLADQYKRAAITAAKSYPRKWS